MRRRHRCHFWRSSAISLPFHKVVLGEGGREEEEHRIAHFYQETQIGVAPPPPPPPSPRLFRSPNAACGLPPFLSSLIPTTSAVTDLLLLLLFFSNLVSSLPSIKSPPFFCSLSLSHSPSSPHPIHTHNTLRPKQEEEKKNPEHFFFRPSPFSGWKKEEIGQ